MPPNGKHHSEETKRKMRENHANFSGENAPMFGMHHSDDTKLKISIANKGRKRSEELKRKLRKHVIQDDILISEYASGKSTGDLAKKHNCCSETIRLRLIGLGVKLRTISEATIGRERAKGRKLSDEHRRKISESNRLRTQSPETREKISASKRGKKRKPFSEEWRSKLATMKGKHHSEESKLKMSAIQKRIALDDNRRKQISERVKLQWQDPTFRESMTGENNPMYGRHGERAGNWKGGRSYEPYCPKFTEKLKEEVREAFGRKCYLCPKTEKENGERLSVHHCDYQKSQGCNGQRWSLLPLCHRCHTLSTMRKWHYFALLRDYWIYEYIDFFNF